MTQHHDTTNQHQCEQREQKLPHNLTTKCKQVTNCTKGFLHQLNPDTYNFAAIQELYLDHNHNSHATQQWYTLYPKQHYLTPLHTRSILLANKHIATDTWTQVDFGSPDIMMVLIQMGHSKVLVIGIYNDMEEQQALH